MKHGTIAENLATVKAQIAESARASGREPGTVRLVAVTKTRPVADIQAAYAAGQRCFGENRVQELRQKRPELPGDSEWHLIGHLQSNKAKPAILNSELIHSVDSARLLNRLEQIAGELGQVQAILLQANISGEASKHGSELDELEALLARALGCGHLECRGFMTMAPFDAGPDDLKRIFSALREFRDSAQAKFGRPLPELSMGMTAGFREAIACGATYVRIGSAIFGVRS